MTINKAIRHAIATIRMTPWGPGLYYIEVYSPSRHAWIIGSNMPYHAARACMTEARHAAALVAVGWAENDAEWEAYYGNGSLRDRVKASLEI